jgi:polyhydroxybutyrate depolymerase
MRKRTVLISLTAAIIVMLGLVWFLVLDKADRNPQLSNGCGKAPPTALGETEVLSLTVGDLEREYRLHLPTDYDQNSSSSLVMVFHWYQGSAKEIESISWISSHADKNGYIAVYPQSTSFDRPSVAITTWNDLSCNASSGSEGPTCSEDFFWPFPPECGDDRDCTWCTCYDDLAFVDQLLDELEDTLCVDRDRVYATGVSNGATFVHRLGCDMADRFAAIAPIAGTLARGFICKPEASTSISIMHLHGDNDKLFPTDGSEGSVGHFLVSVDDVMDAWANTTSQGCDDIETPYLTSRDGTKQLECVQRANCATGAEVVSCSWAGDHQSSMNVNWSFGNDVIWEFFSKNSKQR